jgi:hypothetical protein
MSSPFSVIPKLFLTILGLNFLHTCRASRNEDATERFIEVLRYYLAGWHIKPKGVKKPYVSILLVKVSIPRRLCT